MDSPLQILLLIAGAFLAGLVALALFHKRRQGKGGGSTGDGHVQTTPRDTILDLDNDEPGFKDSVGGHKKRSRTNRMACVRGSGLPF